MDLSDFFCLYKDEMHKVETHLDRYITSDVRLIPDVAHHLIDSGGKRCRPLLHLICARLCGYDGPRRFPLAASIEFIHTASLLHDDVIDEGLLRRGKTSANRVWGNAASVLVGDFLYSRSFEMMVDVGSMRVMDILSHATSRISEGEVLQLLNCNDADTTEARYMEVIERKTATLFQAGTRIGAVLVTINPAYRPFELSCIVWPCLALPCRNFLACAARPMLQAAALAGRTGSRGM